MGRQFLSLLNMIALIARQRISSLCHERGGCGVSSDACRFSQGLALLSTRDPRAYPLVFQYGSEPFSVLAAIAEQPVKVRQVASRARISM